MEHYYALIMAGGGGTRLWPMSRRQTPKQFLPLVEDESMFRVSMTRLAPLFTPLLEQMGVSPIHFGVIMTMNVMIGLITPPYGLALYMGSAVSGVPLGRIVKASLPMLFAALCVLMLVTYVPAICLTLPRMFGFVQ